MIRTPLPTSSRNHRGFSMLEIMIAVALMAFCLIPVLLFNQRNLVEAGVTQEEIVARQLLINMCERFKHEDPAILARLEAQPDLIEGDDFITRIPESQKAFLNIQRLVDFEKNYHNNDGIHRVTFQVRWTSPRRKKERILSLSRLIHWHIS